MAIDGTGASAVADRQLIDRLRNEMRSAADSVRASAQQAYMKSALPYFGITAPGLRTLLRPVLKTYAPSTRVVHEATVLTLWDEATHRVGGPSSTSDDGAGVVGGANLPLLA